MMCPLKRQLLGDRAPKPSKHGHDAQAPVRIAYFGPRTTTYS